MKSKSNKSGRSLGLRIKKDLRTNMPFYILMLPAVICFLLFNYLPMLGIVMAFKNFNYRKGIFGSDWCGLKNFEVFFRNPDAWLITRNTVLYNLVFIFLGLVLAVAAALAINELRNKRAGKVYQTIALMPHFLSYVIVAYLVFAFLGTENGVVNRSLLPALGKEPVNWYSESKYWPYILVFVKMWKSIGYNSIVYLAAICGISPEYYEAATIDGATRRQQIMHITLPGIKPMICIMLINAMGGLFNSDFGLFYNVTMNSGAIFSTTNVLGTYIYRSMGDVSFSTAAGLYVSVVGFIMIMVTNTIVKKIDADSSLF